jgi:hypothetical protein
MMTSLMAPLMTTITPLPCRAPPRPSRFLQSVHLLHRAAVSAKGSPAPRLDLPDEVAMQTHQAATVVFPDRCVNECTLIASDCVFPDRCECALIASDCV